MMMNCIAMRAALTMMLLLAEGAISAYADEKTLLSILVQEERRTKRVSKSGKKSSKRSSKKSGKKSRKRNRKKNSPSPAPLTLQDQLKINLAQTIGLGPVELFPDQVLSQVLEDSPNGFLPGSLDLLPSRRLLPLDEENLTTPTFEVADGNLSGSVEISGTFATADGNIPPGTVVHLYMQDGLRASAVVDPTSGDFRIILTDIPYGYHPFFLTFTDPAKEGGGVQRELGSQRQLEGSYQTPTFGRIGNTQQCGAALTMTLTWDGPTSDIDLDIYEPSGVHVWYDSKQGTDGAFLDYDDVEGFGPENYVAPNAVEGQAYEIKIIMFDFDQDIENPVNWELVARSNGRNLWSKSGTFIYQNCYREELEPFVFLFSGALPCTVCSFAPPSRALVALQEPRELLEPLARWCLDNRMPPREFPYYCHVFPCNDSNRREDYKFYQKALSFTNKQELVVLAAIVYGPSSEVYTDKIITAIRAGTSTLDLVCVRDVILESWCNSCLSREFEEYAKALNYFALIGGFSTNALAAAKVAGISEYIRGEITSGGHTTDIIDAAISVTQFVDVNNVLNLYILGTKNVGCREL